MNTLRLTLWLIVAIAATTSTTMAAVTQYGYQVVARLPHATDRYTQGLQVVDGEMYESTGLYGGRSRLMRVDASSGAAQTLATLPSDQFGEGITILGDTIYMLTWRENMLYMFDRTSGKIVDTRQYMGEGWGLTSDGQQIYMSNGSSQITIRHRETFEPISSHTVTLNGEPLKLLNELEWIEGRIWANIYTTDFIAIINPTTWQVEGCIDLSGLLPDKDRTAQTDVLNGIAYDEATGRIYLTGKLWNTLFEIKIFER
ncbi:MAG: glutaminyl-peptide cyclotransferase [Rikenellaceae bacterium]